MDIHTLRSHPHQSLYEHIAAVREATEAILERHLDEGWMGDKAFQGWAIRLCHLHDLGKGSTYFQEYIQYKPSPQNYPKERHHLKAHTLLSLLISWYLLSEENNSWEDMWAVSQAVLCHHGKLRTSERCEQTGSKTLWEDLESDERVAILEQQLLDLPWKALEAATGEPVTQIDWPPNPWRRAKRDLRRGKHHWEQITHESLHRAVDARLRAQMLYSVLLEADKALLAVREPKRYVHDARSPLQPKEVEQRIENLRNNNHEVSPMNVMREEARCLVKEAAREKGKEAWIHLLALPTGLGKTLSAATWAATMQENHRPKSKVVVVMPFLSIIDQTVQEYQRILALTDQGNRWMASHSLARREYSLEEQGERVDGEEFFLDTWRSEVILTTYDQLLLSLMSPKGKHQMRLHQLCDALIILDELQSIPCRLWSPLQHLLRSLCEHGNTHILAMSATLPDIFSAEVFPGCRLLELLPESKTAHYFQAFDRYTLELRYRQGDEFFSRFLQRIQREWQSGAWEGQRLLITMNTRRSARTLRDELAAVLTDTPLFFLTADVTPRDRLRAIEQIRDLERNGQACLVVATQCIEAGVDLDFDYVIRDFAPLDSLVQIAGRCNRHNQRKTPGRVEVVRLIDDESYPSRATQGKEPSTFCSYIYDEVHLDATLRILGGLEHHIVPERDVRQLCLSFFSQLRKNKDTGEALLQKHLCWETHIDASQELRGEQPEQYTFVVQYPNPIDEEELAQQKAIQRFATLTNSPQPEGEERWARRSELQDLARQIAQSCVTVYARQGFHPEEFGDPCGYLFLLHTKSKDGVPFYTKKRGLAFPDRYQPCLIF